VVDQVSIQHSNIDRSDRPSIPPSATGAIVRIGGFGSLVVALVALLAPDWSIRERLRSNLRVRLPTR
jgi:hypothetical protein